jgi:putative transposase
MTPYVHLVWPTKYRQPLLTKKIKNLIIDYIHMLAIKKGIKLHALNGHVDHLHVLVELQPDQTIDWIVKTLKGTSAYWANNVAHVQPRLTWGVGYFWSYVLPQHYMSVRMYVENQERHHGG